MPIGSNPSGLLNLTTYEQYTSPFCKRYIPDHLERLDAALPIALEHGDKPAWFHDDFCEGGLTGLCGGRHFPSADRSLRWRGIVPSPPAWLAEKWTSE